ncbi:alpha/beta hydrolase [bacterium]|nr:alpha/beta hydrolase [bacterium]
MKTNPILKLLQKVFPFLEKYWPSVADRLFTYLFFRTFRSPFKKKDLAFLAKADQGLITVNKKKVRTYQWGSGEKKVLMVHGWMGRATQFDEFVSFYLDKGFTCVAFDAPGHGMSSGNRTNILEFKEVILELSKIHKGFDMIIAHSLGGAASVLANGERKISAKQILLATPSIGQRILEGFAQGVNASSARFKYLRDSINRKYKLDFDSLMTENTVRSLNNVDLLLINDRKDHLVQLEHPRAILRNYQRTEYYETSDLGHNRMLKNREVIEKTYLHYQEI